MTEFKVRHSNVQKLAETLKRCGIASSVTDAHKIAGDITSTEQKVQNFFDSKKREIHDDFLQKVHPTRFPKRNDFITGNVKEMIDRAINPTPLNIQVDFETPKCYEEKAPEKIPIVQEMKKPEVIIEPKPVVYESSHTHEDISFEYNPEVPDYITRFINNNKEEIPAGEEVVSVKNVAVSEPKPIKTETIEQIQRPQMQAPKVDLANYFGVKKQETQTVKESPKLEPQVQTAPKPAAPSVDLHGFFNFAKRGKV